MAAAAIDAIVAARTPEWTRDERTALTRLIAALRPSPRHLRDILDWLDEIGTREGRRPGSVLADPALERLLTARGSAPDRLKRWKDALRRVRYPRLVAREAEATALVRTMALGPVVRIQIPPALEGGAVTITVVATSADELERALSRLDSNLRAGTMAKLFALLDEL